MTAERRGMLWVGAMALMWVALEMLAGFLRQSYSSYQVVWTRYGVHLLFMIAVWGLRAPRTLWATRRPALQVARSLLMVVMPATVITAMARGVDATTVWTVFWVTPLLIVAFASLWLGERVPVHVWIGCALAVAATSLLLGPGMPRTAGSIILPLLSAASFSLYVVMTRMLRFESIRQNLFYTALGVFAVLTPIVSRGWITPDAHDFAVLSAIGLLGFGALYALDRMASSAQVSSTAPVIAVQVAFTIGGRALLAHDAPGLRAWVGVCLLGAMVIWLWMRPNAAEETAVV